MNNRLTGTDSTRSESTDSAVYTKRNQSIKSHLMICVNILRNNTEQTRKKILNSDNYCQGYLRFETCDNPSEGPAGRCVLHSLPIIPARWGSTAVGA